MSKKDKRTTPFQVPHPAPEPVPGTLGISEDPDFGLPETDMEISEIAFRQQSALPVIAVSRTIAQASRDSGVAERTLRRWLSDPAFREELDRIRMESYDLARKQLQAAMPRALSVIFETAEMASDPALRLRAARYLVACNDRLHELETLRNEIKDLKESAQQARD